MLLASIRTALGADGKAHRAPLLLADHDGGVELLQDYFVTAEVSLGGAYSDLADRAGPQFNGLVNWKNDAGTFGIMLQGFREQRYLRRDGQEELGYANVPSAATLPGPTVGGAATTVPNPFPAGLRGALYPQIINNALFHTKN